MEKPFWLSSGLSRYATSPGKLAVLILVGYDPSNVNSFRCAVVQFNGYGSICVYLLNGVGTTGSFLLVSMDLSFSSTLVGLVSSRMFDGIYFRA